MDNFPRLRRKPKPPAIETSVPRVISRDASESAFAADAASQSIPRLASQMSPMMKKSSLHTLKHRVATKRSRTQSPAARPLSQHTMAVFNQDEVFTSRPGTEDASSTKRAGRFPAVLPVFLRCSDQDLDSKFQDLTWAERNRLAQGTRPENPVDRWASFNQTDAALRGTMDRYVNIRPWNHNRVRLRVARGAFDYVNASTITLNPLRDDSLPPLRYIAMQGPTRPSFTYVWRMIAEQTASPAVVVQLTSMVEGGAVKCHQYFPDGAEEPVWALNKENIWGDDWKATLTYDSREDVADGSIEKRKLLLHVDGEAEPRVVWHLLYTRWPDFGVPALDDMGSFLELMRISRQLSDANHPRIVHCSAGVGRTGTFITLEHLMRELSTGALAHPDFPVPSDPIYDTVDRLRQQRRSMVQSDVQYRFLYDVMRNLWQDKYVAPFLSPAAHHPSCFTSMAEPAPKRLEIADALYDADDAPSRV